MPMSEPELRIATTEPMFVCDTCGCAVLNENAHWAWHEFVALEPDSE